MTDSEPSTADFERAMRAIRKPGGQIPKFLRAHFDAHERPLSIAQLNRSANYRAPRAINRVYSQLARRIGVALGKPKEKLSLLTVGVPAPKGSGSDWFLVMKPEFATAVKNVGWI